MDSDSDAPITLDYFNTNAFKKQFKGIVEFSGVFMSGTLDPTNIVNDYIAATDQQLNSGDKFIRFFDSAVGGFPEIWLFDGSVWSYNTYIEPELGDFYRVLNFVNNWDGTPFTDKTTGTIT